MKPFHFRRSIVSWLTSWYALSLFVLVLLVTVYLYWTLFSALRAENRAVLLDRLQTVNALISRDEESLTFARDRVRLEWPSRHFERVYVRVIGREGTPILESPSIPAEVIREVFGGQISGASRSSGEGTVGTPVTVVRTSNGMPYLTATTAVRSSPSEYARIFVALDLSRQDEILTRYQVQILVALFVSFCLATLVGRRLAKSAFEPVERIVDQTRRIRSSTLHERVETMGLPDELDRLAGTVNEMLDRLEDSFERLSRFSSDLAHELRTPINNILGEAEVALSNPRSPDEYRDVIASGLEELRRVTRMIDSLLFLARSEQPEMQIRRERIDVRSELLNILEFYEVSAAEEQISIHVTAPDGLALMVERTLFQRALGNLVANAISYNRPGGEIVLDVRERGGRVEISVTDTGQGIPSADLPKVFDRFYRVDPARKANRLGGFGLGLTIVKSIVQLHHGDIKIDSEAGKWTRVTLSFDCENVIS